MTYPIGPSLTQPNLPSALALHQLWRMCLKSPINNFLHHCFQRRRCFEMETLQLKKVGATPSTFFVAATKNRKTEKPMNFGFNWMKVKKGLEEILVLYLLEALLRDRNRRKKAQYPAGIEPMNSRVFAPQACARPLFYNRSHAWTKFATSGRPTPRPKSTGCVRQVKLRLRWIEMLTASLQKIKFHQRFDSEFEIKP